MNQGAVLVSEALLGLDFRIFLLGGEPCKVSPPTIRNLCRAIRQFGRIDMPTGTSLPETLAAIPDIAERLTAGLACLFEDEQLAREKLAECSVAQLFSITQDIISLVSPDDFFACAALALNVAKMAATPKQ